MRLCTLILLFMLTGCDFLSQNTTTQKSQNRTVVCKLNDFGGFPRQVTGPVVFELRTTITIAIFNHKRTERVDMTFPKSKCR